MALGAQVHRFPVLAVTLEAVKPSPVVVAAMRIDVLHDALYLAGYRALLLHDFAHALGAFD
jgi:hypothetical protein